MTQKIVYNNMTMIMLHLEPSVGLISDFYNWSDFEDNQIIELKNIAKQNNLKTTLFVLADSETSYGLYDLDQIYLKAEQNKIDYVVFYLINPFITKQDDNILFLNVKDFLKIEKILISNNCLIEQCTKFNTKSIQDYWKNNCLILNDFKDKQINQNLINYLKESKFDEFKNQTHYYYQFTGRVAKGKQFGRQIGFPTINLETMKPLMINKGVYLCDVYIDHLDKHFLGAGCYWVNELNKEVFETYIFDFNQEIYEWKVTITPFKKIRDNIIPKDVEHLKELLTNDVNQIKKQKDLNIYLK